MADKFLSFEEVMKKLGVSKAELEGMVGDGRLRAFRVGGQTKFKDADVEELSHSSTDATVVPDGDVELAKGAADDLLESGTEEIVFDEEVDENAATAEFDADDATTQELTLDEGNVFDSEAGVATEQVDVDGADAGGTPSSSRRRAAAAPSRRIASFPIDKPPIWVSIALVATIMVLVLAAMSYYQQARFKEAGAKIFSPLNVFADPLRPAN
ncbi:MAG: helix-turn-helix domain-containing protein [Planctomycetota bacterium]